MIGTIPCLHPSSKNIFRNLRLFWSFSESSLHFVSSFCISFCFPFSLFPFSFFAFLSFSSFVSFSFSFPFSYSLSHCIVGNKYGRDFLYGVDVPEQERARTKRMRAAVLFIESYRDLPLLAWPRLLLDKVAELEEKLVLFRTHHARMVERIIGRRVGTGGSSGVDYLDSTTKYRVFPELWVVRTILLPKTKLPLIADPSVYGFATQSNNVK
eukprot:TRINITY_DN3878_c0_g1_i1.p1 TRINITY_DN3878_c0_g1~~TRINITY_DN3878_c0_g1_i1.p1  ORF type:complete len:211 (+),score=35.81 TRINITY_DN3878_c0_g1_i1:957-1589(+)